METSQILKSIARCDKNIERAESSLAQAKAEKAHYEELLKKK